MHAGHADLQLGGHRSTVLRTGRRPPAGRLHPVHRQAHDEAVPGETAGRRTEDGPGRPARRPQRQPAARPHSARWRPSNRTRRPARRLRGRRKQSHGCACWASRRKLPPVDRLQPRPAEAGEPARFGFNLPATTSTCERTSPGTATTTRASRSTCRRRRSRRCRCSKTASSSRTGSSSTAGPATAPSSPPRAPASDPAVGAASNTSTRPGCLPAPYEEENPDTELPAPS